MIKYRGLWPLCILVLLLGCSSELDYRNRLDETANLINSSAKACIAASQANVVTASAAIGQQPNYQLKADIVNSDTKADLEERRLKVEMQMAGIDVPSVRFKDAHTSLVGFNDIYKKLHELAIEPSGTIAQYEHVLRVLSQVIDEKFVEFQNRLPAE